MVPAPSRAWRVKSKNQKWKVRDHAWFAAMAPSADPEIVVIVFVEHGGGGSSAAAPVAMATIDAWWTKKQARAGRSPGPMKVTVLDDDGGLGHHHDGAHH